MTKNLLKLISQKIARIALGIFLACPMAQFAAAAETKGGSLVNELPLKFESSLENNILTFQITNVSRATIIVQAITSKSLDFEIEAMSIKASGKIGIKSLKPNIVTIHSADTLESQLAQIAKLFADGPGIKIPPNQSEVMSVDVSEIIAPYKNAVTSDTNTKLLLKASVPNLILGNIDAGGKFVPLVNLFNTQFYSNRFILEGGQWRRLGRVSNKK